MAWASSRPLGDERYDLILDLRPRLSARPVQMGRTSRRRRRRDRSSARGRGRARTVHRYYAGKRSMRLLRTARRPSSCYLLPHDLSVGARRSSYAFRRPGTTKQTRIKWARDFELGATLTQFGGPIAQLGERRVAARRSPVRARLGPPEKPPTGASFVSVDRQHMDSALRVSIDSPILVKQVLWSGTSTAS